MSKYFSPVGNSFRKHLDLIFAISIIGIFVFATVMTVNYVSASSALNTWNQKGGYLQFCQTPISIPAGKVFVSGTKYDVKLPMKDLLHGKHCEPVK